jgi:NAD(P)-dependent dehydrogenase (short-subunit alcohol dehydrogenase family)
MAKRVEGKVALVTGGSRGIGRATCLLLASEGAAVVVNYLAQERAATNLVQNICDNGGRAIAIRADVAEKQQVQEMVARAIDKFGRIDILVNNAGIFGRATTTTMNDEDFDRMFEVNVKGVIHCVRAVVDGMMDRRHGKIVNISSMAGVGNSVEASTPYAATKATVIALTKRQALEFGPHNINVNCVCPGFTQTEMLNGGVPPDQERLATLANRAVLGRVGKPEDIANVVLFLCSEESSFITAQAISVDGGRMDLMSRSA